MGPTTIRRHAIIDSLRAVSEKAPDALALEDGHRALTYAELMAAVDRVAEQLDARGVGPDRLIGHCFDRSVDAVVGLLGILATGAGYVPVDPRYPTERIRHTLEDAGVSLCLSAPSTLQAIEGVDAPTVTLEGTQVVGNAVVSDRGRRVEGVAYVVYTSGSTGRAKGVPIGGDALLAYAEAMTEALGIESTDRYLHTASFAFSSSVRQWVLPLFSGATLVVAGRSQIADARALLDYIKAQGATVADLVPSYLRSCIQVLEEEDPGRRRALLDNDLRLLVTASEPLPGDLVHGWRSRLGHGARMINMFGQTETAGIVCTYPIPDDLPERGIVPVGRPLPGVAAVLLDEAGALLPPGSSGELAVVGPTLTKGYLGLDEVTAEKFVEVEGEDGISRRFYRTGDRVRQREDGVFEFLGRQDNQVKVRGHRVELEEVETRLSAHPSVREAGVRAQEAPGGGTMLVGAVVLASDAEFESAALRRWVGLALPDYMVPGAVVRVESLPRTPNGKLDRAGLAKLEMDRLDVSEAYVAPRSEMERTIATVWSEYLGVPSVGIHDGFFELGGHSLLAMRLVARIRRDLGTDIPVRTLFENPTVAELAAAVESAAQGAGRPPLEADTAGGDVQPSFAQQRLWLLHQLDPESSAYNLLAAIRLIGSLNTQALGQAVNRILERHGSLRTVFPNVAGVPGAVVRDHEPVSLAIEEVDGESAMVERVREETGRPYDLEEGPLFRVGLLRLSPDEHVLYMGMHHIVSDGWSRGVLYDELAQLYSAFAAGEEDPLPALQVQFSDYARWQEQWLEEDGLAEQQSYWTETLTGAPATSELPTSRPRPPIQTFNGDTLTFSLPESLTREVRRFGSEEGASPFMVYLATLGVLLGRYTGQDDVVVGSPTAGRGDPATEPLIGFFVNTLALRLPLGEEPTFRTVLQRVREVVLGALANQDLPFDRVVDGLDLPRDLSRSPLFQVMFILQNTPPATHRPAGLRMDQIGVTLDAAKYDLTLSLVTGEHGMSAQLEYNTDLFDEAFIERVGANFIRLLEEAVSQPDAAVASLPLMDPEEEHTLFVDWNQTDVPLEEGLTVHGAFERQVRLTPDAVALVSGGESMTYAELHRRSSRVADHLARLGVGPETLVGVCVDRSLEMMVGLLGVLKAGGAYVPLDPTYPRDRIAFMIQDSECPVILTQEHILPRLPRGSATRVCLDRDWEQIEATPGAPVSVHTRPEQLAYVIYTSGSTGRPKGVMVEHRNVLNFFKGMDERVGHETPIRWLAVTSISFDISVLELFWTLARGSTVVIQPDEPQAAAPGTTASSRPIDFSLFFWGTEAKDQEDPYRLILECARFGDDHGFSGVWIPERHFHSFGGMYPSPNVIAGALAAITRRVKIRAGSVVLPLHDTLRVAEDWSVVDHLSKGRVELAFASGWHDRDFVFQPQNWENRRDVMMQQIDEVQRLWRGESIERIGGEGTPHEVSTLPRPIQKTLPVFVTAAGSPGTFEKAGESGSHLLTHLLGQSPDELGEKIQIYRKAWEDAGHEGLGTVSLMMHTFVGEDLEEVRELVWHPFRGYLRTAVGLIAGLAKGRGQDIRSADFTEDDMEALLDHAFDRYFQTSSLLGTPESTLAMIERVKELDVDEVACLVDFGVPEDRVIESLSLLNDVHRMANPEPRSEDAAEDMSVAAQISRHDITHMQCTPSYAELVLAQPGGREALGRLECLMVGGEALPLALARELDATVGGRVLNMYGPTETTIWSSTAPVDGDAETVSLGRPIANTDLFVMDRRGEPVPIGVPGELWIGGRGVVRGYWQRPELTSERFIDHPFEDGSRVYRTGDLVRYREDGTLEFLGRLDHQVKVRGHRIELGEIETLLRDQDTVREAVVVAREDVPGDKRLVAYVVLTAPSTDFAGTLKDALRVRLPEWMVPQHLVALEELPRTPNGKTDRNALPAPDMAAATTEFVEPESDLEKILAEVWQDVLRRPSVGTQDNFFDLGGHSLLTVKVQAGLKERTGRVIPITDLFRFPTIRTLAQHLGSGDDGADRGAEVTEAASERAAARRGAMSRRRNRSRN